MTDRIEPALTERQWEYRQREGWLGEQEMMGAQFLLLDGRELVFVNNDDPRYSPLLPRIGADEIPALIALANAALKDDDPRKIRREWIEELRDQASNLEMPIEDENGVTRFVPDATLSRIADALQSYLPPE